MGEQCQFTDEDDCKVYFAYRENENRQLEIFVKRKRGELHFWCQPYTCLLTSLLESLKALV